MLRRATSITDTPKLERLEPATRQVSQPAPRLERAVPAAAASLPAQARVRAMFEAHHQLVWRSLRRYGLDADAAADVTQQAFVVVMERVSDIWPGSERAFLMGSALRLARSARRNSARYSLDPQLEERLVQSGPHPERQASTVELLDRVLGQLDDDLIEVFVLFDIEGFSGPELASALGIPLGTVASRVRRAREAFRAASQRVERTREREEGR